MNRWWPRQLQGVRDTGNQRPSKVCRKYRSHVVSTYNTTEQGLSVTNRSHIITPCTQDARHKVKGHSVCSSGSKSSLYYFFLGGVILSPIPYKIEISILWQAYNYIFIFIGIYNWKFSSSITEDVGLCLKLELLFHVMKQHDPKRVEEEWICFAYSYTP